MNMAAHSMTQTEATAYFRSHPTDVGFIIGRGGTTIKRIAEETHTYVRFDKTVAPEGCFVVTGGRPSDINEAMIRLEKVANEARKRNVSSGASRAPMPRQVPRPTQPTRETLKIRQCDVSLVIGKKGTTIKMIAHKSGCRVHAERTSDASIAIVNIEGPTHEAVAEAIRLVTEIAQTAYTRNTSGNEALSTHREDGHLRTQPHPTPPRHFRPTSPVNPPPSLIIDMNDDESEDEDEELEAKAPPSLGPVLDELIKIKDGAEFERQAFGWAEQKYGAGRREMYAEPTDQELEHEAYLVEQEQVTSGTAADLSAIGLMGLDDYGTIFNEDGNPITHWEHQDINYILCEKTNKLYSLGEKGELYLIGNRKATDSWADDLWLITLLSKPIDVFEGEED